MLPGYTIPRGCCEARTLSLVYQLPCNLAKSFSWGAVYTTLTVLIVCVGFLFCRVLFCWSTGRDLNPRFKVLQTFPFGRSGTRASVCSVSGFVLGVVVCICFCDGLRGLWFLGCQLCWVLGFCVVSVWVIGCWGCDLFL